MESFNPETPGGEAAGQEALTSMRSTPGCGETFPRWTGLFCFVPSHCAAYGLFLL